MPSSLKPMTMASAHHGQVRVRSGVELLTRQSIGGSVDRSGSDRRLPGSAEPQPNQSRASSTTSAMASGSLGRTEAQGTCARRAVRGNCGSARSFGSRTAPSVSPTTSCVGKRTRRTTSPARSGRPARENTARTQLGRAAAAMSTPAAPVPPPYSAAGSPPVRGRTASSSASATTRAPSVLASKPTPVPASTSRSSAVRSSRRPLRPALPHVRSHWIPLGRRHGRRDPPR